MASRFHGRRILTPDCKGMMGAFISEAMRGIADRFRRCRDDQETWAALRHLDDHQLKEFGIYPRPADLIEPKFP